MTWDTNASILVIPERCQRAACADRPTLCWLGSKSNQLNLSPMMPHLGHNILQCTDCHDVPEIGSCQIDPTWLVVSRSSKRSAKVRVSQTTGLRADILQQTTAIRIVGSACRSKCCAGLPNLAPQQVERVKHAR